MQDARQRARNFWRNTNPRGRESDRHGRHRCRQMRDFRRSASNGRGFSSNRGDALFSPRPRSRCRKNLPSGGAGSQGKRRECAVFAAEPDQREIIDVVYITQVRPRQYSPQLYQLDTLSSSPTISINRLLLRKQTSTLPTYHLNPNDQQLHNNVVVLSIPKGRDQADPGRMLVSLGPPPRRPLDLPTDATSSLFLSCGTKCSPISGSEACSCPGQCSCAGCPNRKTEAVDSDPKEGCS